MTRWGSEVSRRNNVRQRTSAGDADNKDCSKEIIRNLIEINKEKKTEAIE